MRMMRLLAVLPAFLAASMSATAAVQDFKVTTDRTIDASSLESIVQQVVVRSGARSNDEKAIALYEWLHGTIFHWAYPTEPAPQSVGPLKVINVYGWGLCGGQHTVLKALYETAGWPCRYVGWSNPGHTTIEVNYDGRWHYFDVFLKCYFWSKDKSHVVSQEEIAADPSLVMDALKDGRAARQHLCCGDEAADVVRGIRSRKVAGDVKGWASVTWRDADYSPLLRLPAGASLRLDWGSESNGFAVNGKAPRHSCGTKDFRNDRVLGPVLEHYGPRQWANGRLAYAPDFAKSADVADIELAHAQPRAGKLVAEAGLGSAVFKLSSPAVLVRATVTAGFDGDGRLSFSTDAGRTWQAIRSGEVSPQVKQKYEVWVKAEFSGALTQFTLDALVEHNRGALPYLVNGKNNITVSTERNEIPGDAELVVTYSYQEATVADPASRNRWDGGGITYGEPKTVTREIRSLPNTFQIEVAGNTPPRMLSLERALRARR